MTFLLPPETGGGPRPVEGLSGMLGRGHWGPGLRPWPVGYRSPHGSARGSGLCTSCVLFLTVYESMLWGHRACSNKSSLRLRCVRRFCGLRAP